MKDVESWNEFLSDISCILALQIAKRVSHNLQIHLLFVDLIKIYGSIVLSQ